MFTKVITLSCLIAYIEQSILHNALLNNSLYVLYHRHILYYYIKIQNVRYLFDVEE